MCHHSLPGIVTPAKNKKHINSILGGDLITILTTYCFLCITAVFAFGDVHEKKCEMSHPGHPCQIQKVKEKRRRVEKS